MRATLRLALAATALGLVLPPPAFAAPDQVAQAEPAQPKEVALTQGQIDGIIAAQPQMQAIESKQPQGAEDKPDPKIDAKLEAVAKKNGFSGLGEYADVSYSVGLVFPGIDPETKSYVGSQAVIKKQMAQLKADNSMPPKEKKEALDELSAAAQQSGDAPKPTPANIAIVTKNYDKLSATMQQQGGGD